MSNQKGINFYLIIAAIGIIPILLLSSAVVTAIPIDSCMEINNNGNYELNNNWNVGNSAVDGCIRITSSDVSLDGKNFSIIGGGTTTYTVGVLVHNKNTQLTNVTVKNIRLNNWDEGLVYNNTANGTISNNIVTSNINFSILLDFSQKNTIVNNNVSFNGRGIRIFSSHNNTVKYNKANNNSNSGIKLNDGSTHNNILENIASYNQWEGGIVLDLQSNYNTINNNTAISNNGNGIIIRDSNYNNIIGNTASYSRIYGEYNSSGIKLEYSDHNIISNNTGISNSDVGIDLFYSNDSTIFNNSLFYNKAGIAIGQSSNNIVIGNNVSSNIAAGINVIFGSKDNVVKGNTAGNNSYSGISLFYAGENNTVIGNDLYGNGYEGIFLKQSSKNLIYDNIVVSNTIDGIVLKNSSDHNTLINNTVIQNGDMGILIMNSSYSDIEGNTVSDHRGETGEPFDRPPSSGIMVYGSHNLIRKNKVSNNYLGISILNSSSSNDIISTNNTIEDNEVLNNTGLDMDENKPHGAGISIGRSDNNTVRNNTASYNSVGIALINSSGNNTISGNEVLFNERGIRLFNSNYNTIDNNIVEYNDRSGIKLNETSIHNIISNNLVTNSNKSGIVLVEGSDDNLVKNNIVNSNLLYGIDIASSNSNIINNNIFNNSINYRSRSSLNIWNVTLKLEPNIIGGDYQGGNFWVHPNGTGFSRSCADSDNDGICDSYYELVPGNIDHLPLAEAGGETPVADCGPDKLKCENVASPVKFNASASYDPDGAIISYYWEFGDGTNATGMKPVHKYSTYRRNATAYQPFTVNLTVTDNSGLTNTTSQKVVIWIAGDANGDGIVNILDATLIGAHWKETPANPRFSPCADLNNDNVIDILDATQVGKNWGKKA